MKKLYILFFENFINKNVQNENNKVFINKNKMYYVLKTLREKNILIKDKQTWFLSKKALFF